MCYLAPTFNANISGWNVSEVKYMKSMFGMEYVIYPAFSQDLSPKWDVGNVETFEWMFYDSAY